MPKGIILSWLEGINSSGLKRDSVVVILCAHGRSDDGVILECGGVNEVSNASGDIYDAERPCTRSEIPSAELKLALCAHWQKLYASTVGSEVTQ